MVGGLLAVVIAAGAVSVDPPPRSLGKLDRLLVGDTLEGVDPATRETMDRLYRNCVAGCGLPYGSLCGRADKSSCLSQIHSCRVDCAMERTAIEEALSKRIGHR